MPDSTHSPNLAEALLAHIIAQADINKHVRETDGDDIPDCLADAELNAWDSLRAVKCACAEELLLKLGYMVAQRKFVYESHWIDYSADVLLAIDHHFAAKGRIY